MSVLVNLIREPADYRCPFCGLALRLHVWEAATYRLPRHFPPLSGPCIGSDTAPEKDDRR